MEHSVSIVIGLIDFDSMNQVFSSADLIFIARLKIKKIAVLGITLSHLRPRFAYKYILEHYGHARSQGGRQPPRRSPAQYLAYPVLVPVTSHFITGGVIPRHLR